MIDDKCIVKRDGELDLSFHGQLIATVSGKRREDQVAWEDLFLWETVMGQFVVQRVRHDNAFGETAQAMNAYHASDILKWLKGEDEYVSDDIKRLLAVAASHNVQFAEIATVQLD